MNVGELKKALEGLDDNLPITTSDTGIPITSLKATSTEVQLFCSEDEQTAVA